MPITKATGQAVAPAAKGDLVVGSATNDAAVLGVGSADQVLTVDSSTTTGLKWATPSAGGMTLISEQVASGLSSLSFSSIAGTYKQLYLVWSGIYHSNADSTFDIRLNNDSGSSYSLERTQFQNGGVTQADGIGTILAVNGAFAPFGYRVNSTTSSKTAKGYLVIDNYSSTTKHKAYNGNWSFENNSLEDCMMLLNGLYLSTSAITSIDIVRTAGTGTFSNLSNTSVRLYGVS